MGLPIDPLNQILQTNIMRIIWQTVRRITNEILGVKGLTLSQKISGSNLGQVIVIYE